MKVIFDREAIIQILDHYPFKENAVGIFDTGDAGFLKEEEQKFIIDSAVSFIMK
jgi:hypothetical protein